MAKKYAYTFKEIAEEVMRKLPGHYKNFDSANATVRTTARELNINDINGKGHHKIVPAVHAEIILKAVIEKATRRPYTPSTPIESAIREAEKEDVAVQSIKIDPAMKHAAQRTAELITQTGPFEKTEKIEVPTLTVEEKDVLKAKLKDIKPSDLRPMTPEEIQRDEFEIRRRRFYTDVNYFLKFAQSPDERTEIWGALSALYGISAQAPKQTAQPIPTETTEQRDKWSI